jgi:hypothetical protein
MTKKILTPRSDTRFIKANNPKAIDVLNEIKAELLAQTDNDKTVASIADIIIASFKLRTTKQ